MTPLLQIRVSAAAAVLALVPVSMQFSSTEAAPTASVRAADDTELEKHMDKINKLSRSIRTALRAEELETEELAKMAHEMSTHANAAKVLTPQQIKEVPEDAHAKFMSEYRVSMIEFVQGVLALEAEILKGDKEKAKTAYKALNKMKSSAHKIYKIKD